MKPVFVDSSGFFAHLVTDDAFHTRAKQIFSKARADRSYLVTTNAVVFETYTLARTRPRNGREVTLTFLDDLKGGFCKVQRVTEDDEDRAITLLRAHADKVYSFFDALSFVVMERLGVQDAIAFDQDFRSYGRFTVL